MYIIIELLICKAFLNMAIKFSCSLKFSEAFRENHIAVYQPSNGDEYRVKYKSNVCRDLMLSIEWTVPKQVLVTVKLFSKSFKKCFSSKGAVVNGCKTFLKLRGAFNVSGSPDYTILCLISLIPYVKFRNISIQSEKVIEKRDSNQNVESQAVETRNSPGGSPKITDPNKNVLDAESTIVSEKDLSDDCLSSEFSADGDIVTANNNTLNMETQEYETVASHGCTEIFSCTKIKSPGLLKSTHCLSPEKNDCDVNSLNFATSADSTACVKTKECLFLKDDQEIEKNNMENTSTTKEGNPNNILPEDISIEDCSVLGIESQESPVDGQGLSMDVLDIPETNSENISLLISTDSPKSDQTIANEMQQMTMEIQENLTNQEETNFESNCIEMMENKVSESDIFADKDKGTENETLNLTKNEPEDIASSHVKKEDTEIQTHLFSDIPTKNFPLVDFSKLSEEKCAFIKDDSKERETDHSVMKIHQTSISEDMLQKQVSAEVKDLKNDSLADCCQDSFRGIEEIEKVSSVENTTVEEKNEVKECNSTDSIFSSKADLVSETLIQKLSKDSILKLYNEIDTSGCHTEIENKSSAAGDGITKKCFPVMESSLNGLSMDMLDLLMSGDLTDGILTNGVKEVRIHKAILSARSPVLKDIFMPLTQNKMEKRVTVDIPDDVLEDFVVFLYTGLISIKNISMAHILYDAARKYCINDLLEICLKYL